LRSDLEESKQSWLDQIETKKAEHDPSKYTSDFVLEKLPVFGDDCDWSWNFCWPESVDDLKKPADARLSIIRSKLSPLRHVLDDIKLELTTGQVSGGHIRRHMEEELVRVKTDVPIVRVRFHLI